MQKFGGCRTGDAVLSPPISTGIFGFLKNHAVAIAIPVMCENEQKFDRIIACLFDDGSVELYQAELSRSEERT